ncbi:Hydroxyacylglutathione hydrolase GloB [Buchnera aphidicola (Pemphigus populi)]
MILHHIKIFLDNYIWILSNTEGLSIIVDPGKSLPVIRYIKKNKLYPVCIFLTHYHEDHIGGVEAILKYYPKIKIYGPPGTTYIKNVNFVYEKTIIDIIKYRFSVISTPGHTINDISYYCPPYLFCGDTLFSGGCGKIITGNMKLMFHSLKKIFSLPNNTLICFGHEYTVSNLYFSRYILPEDRIIFNYLKVIQKRLKKNKSIPPGLLENEKKINLFLRTNEFFLKKRIGSEEMNCNEEEFFYILRIMKDNFYYGAKRDRTADLLRAKQALSQLSYSP